jgi:hypothetical protein
MISLTCTNCRALLSIDDAFAGGVCRCQHCGTIQTVPSRLKSGTPKPSKVDPSTKTLYKRGRSDGTTGSGTGLDDLAEVVASSGLLGSGSGSGLTSSRLRRRSRADGNAPAPRSLAPWLAIAGVVIVVLLAALLWMSMRRSRESIAATQQQSAPQVEAQPHEASFCGIKLDAPVVIYLLDRGNATQDMFDTLKEVTYRSIESLGPDRKFQVIFWNNGQRDDAYPAGTPSYATPQNIAAARRAMDDITAFGQSDPTTALRKAIANRADLIVLATAKGLELDGAFVENAMSIRGKSTAKIDTIALGDANSSILRDLANRTGGEYRTVSAAKLRSFME